MARKYTCKVLEMMDEGLIDPKWLAEALAGWCSEDSMKQFYECCLELPMANEEEEEETESRYAYTLSCMESDD